MAIEACLRGLELAGWSGDRSAAVEGYALAGTLRWVAHIDALPVVMDPARRAGFAERWRRDFNELMSDRVVLTRFFLERAARIGG